jgi:hypothetical protein
VWVGGSEPVASERIPSELSIPISSSSVRRRLSDGQPPNFLTDAHPTARARTQSGFIEGVRFRPLAMTEDHENGALIRVYADSLGMPRVADGVPWHATYAEELRRDLESRTGHRHSLFTRSRGGATTTDLLDVFGADRFYLGRAGGVLILQSGIVDCAPRPVPKAVRRLIERLSPALRRPIVHLLHTHRRTLLRLGPVWRMTSPDAFRAALEQILGHAIEDADTVLVVNIAPTIDSIERHSPGLGASITEYNELISTVVGSTASDRVKLIDVHHAITHDAAPVETFISPSDGHHLTRDGHALYARLLAEAAGQA